MNDYMMRMLMAKTDEEKAAILAEYQAKKEAAERSSRIQRLVREYNPYAKRLEGAFKTA